MKYLKKFAYNSDYESYMNGEGEVFLPNVSYVVDNNVVYYKPFQLNSFTGIIDVNIDMIVGGILPFFEVLYGGSNKNIKLISVDGKPYEYSVTRAWDDMGYQEYIGPMYSEYISVVSPGTGEHTFKVEVEDTNSFNSFFHNSTFKDLDLSNLETSNVTDMSGMFSGCQRLTSLDLSTFNTSNVTKMNNMFQGSKNLTSLNLSNFNTNKVTNMHHMFDGCSGLTSLDLSNFNTSNVTDMSGMFSSCRSLTNLDLSNFDTSNVTNMNWMFQYCSGLTILDLSNWNISNVTSMSMMFNSCTKLAEVRMGGNPSKVSSVTSMFGNITTTGKFYYNSAYDYSKIIGVLPSTWTAVACTLTDGVLIPNA